MKWGHNVVAVGVLTLIAACAGAPPPPESAARERVVETTATVEAVNPDTREVMIRTTDGRVLTVEAGSDVRNFDQIETGDTIRMTFVESVVAEMAAIDDAGEPQSTVVVGRAPEGARPGALVGAEVSNLVTFESFDPATDTVTFTTGDGLTHSVVLTDPALRAFAQRRERGDRVRVVYSEGLAITIEETTG